jgi:hypothetical protein
LKIESGKLKVESFRKKLINNKENEKKSIYAANAGSHAVAFRATGTSNDRWNQ